MSVPRRRASELSPHYKVRVVLPGFCVHLASTDEPTVTDDGVTANWITDPDYGDTVGFIDWTVVAVTWRWHG